MSDIEGKAARVGSMEWNRGDASDIDGQTERSKRAGAHESISNGQPGRCDPDVFGNVAHNHGYRAGTLSLLLRAAVCARGYAF